MIFTVHVLLFYCFIGIILTLFLRYEFKANPINAAVFDMGGLMGVPRQVPRQSLMPPATPELATKKRCLERKEREDTGDVSAVAFIANPMPDFSKVTVSIVWSYTAC